MSQCVTFSNSFFRFDFLVVNLELLESEPIFTFNSYPFPIYAFILLFFGDWPLYIRKRKRPQKMVSSCWKVTTISLLIFLTVQINYLTAQSKYGTAIQKRDLIINLQHIRHIQLRLSQLFLGRVGWPSLISCE